MKIVVADNFNTETRPEVLVAENVHKYWGPKIVEMLNEKEGPNSIYFHKLVPDDYKLYVPDWMQE